MEKYKIEVTKEQLHLIAKACDITSRMRSGQLREIETCLNDLTDWGHDQRKVESLIKEIKGECGLEPNQSIGIRQSTQTARELYEIYYMIYHFFEWGVYKSNLLAVTEKPKIKIIKIE